jgi:hypothetical protein
LGSNQLSCFDAAGIFSSINQSSTWAPNLTWRAGEGGLGIWSNDGGLGVMSSEDDLDETVYVDAYESVLVRLSSFLGVWDEKEGTVQR